MQIVIPMAGFGQRFVDHGYTLPKPLIPVDGKPMIAHVVDMFPGEDDFVFVCNEKDLSCTRMEHVLRSLKPQGRIVGIATEKKGPVHGILDAERRFPGIIKEEPTIVSYCDFSMWWSYADFLTFLQRGCDGAIVTYTGFHPHHLGSTFYGYLRLDDRGRLVEIREKEPFTSQPMNEHAAAGMYYFRDGSAMKRYFREIIDRNIHKNGEHYVSLPFNLMVRDGLNVRAYDVDHFLQWGTPEDLEEYQYWSNLFSLEQRLTRNITDEELRGAQQLLPQRTPEQLRKTYQYWQAYFTKKRGR